MLGLLPPPQGFRTLQGPPGLGAGSDPFPKDLAALPNLFLFVSGPQHLCQCVLLQGRWGCLVVLKFEVLGEGALGALLGEPVDRPGVLWSLGESCSSCIC